MLLVALWSLLFASFFLVAPAPSAQAESVVAGVESLPVKCKRFINGIGGGYMWCNYGGPAFFDVLRVLDPAPVSNHLTFQEAECQYGLPGGMLCGYRVSAVTLLTTLSYQSSLVNGGNNNNLTGWSFDPAGSYGAYPAPAPASPYAGTTLVVPGPAPCNGITLVPTGGKRSGSTWPTFWDYAEFTDYRVEVASNSTIAKVEIQAGMVDPAYHTVFDTYTIRTNPGLTTWTTTGTFRHVWRNAEWPNGSGGYGSRLLLNVTMMRCTDTGGAVTRKFLDTSQTATPTTPGASRTCADFSFTYSANVLAVKNAGDTIGVTYNFSGINGTQTTAVLAWAWLATPSQPAAQATWVTLGTYTKGQSGSATLTVPPGAASGTTRDLLRWRCTDERGASVIATLQPGYANPDATPPGLFTGSRKSVSECWGEADFGIAPTSWVPAAFGVLVCVATVLFVPRQMDVQTYMGPTFDQSIVGAGFTAISSVGGALSAISSSAGSCEGPTTNLPLGPIGGTIQVRMMDACSGPAQTVRSVAFTLALFLLWSAFGVAVFNLAMSTIGHEDRIQGGKVTRPR
jgi:hypothetical protein